jgi:NADPH-dependent glutamate synthase beta subunit-like oxidoreductase
VDKPICVRSLKGFASKYVIEKSNGYEPKIKTRRKEKIAVVGSGPAGLSAAYYLAIEGYDITVFEALPEAGGMLRVGIPPHRLPKDLLDKEIETVAKLGVRIRTNMPVGPDLSLEDIFNQGFSAVFLGIGAHKPISLGLAGEDAEGVIQGVVYLRKLNLGEPVPECKKVVVIGGGNVAVDVARSVLRMGAENVRILYRRTRREMPAYEEEIEQALEEGVTITYLSAPESILTEGNRVAGVRCVRMRLGDPDTSGRRRPIPILGSEYGIEADLVIPAIGQTTHTGPLEKFQGLWFTRGGTIKVDPLSFATDRPGVFAGGDAVTGPATVIEAISAGKKAATAIDAFIKGKKPKFPPVPLKKMHVERFEVSEERMNQLVRPEMPLLSMEKRTSSFEQVELGLTEKMARDEAKRCLRCDLT